VDSLDDPPVDAEHEGENVTHLARRIADHDARAAQDTRHDLRFQWNVPTGLKPHIPVWLSLTFFGLLVSVIAYSVALR
jgi:hypothetical protein